MIPSAGSKHSDVLIGETLDDLYYGRATISSIPRITVVWIDGKWYSVDNRRLWIFKQLEKLGKCGKIPVHIGCDISDEKLTITNDGFSVRLRGLPGGNCYSKLKKSVDPPRQLYHSQRPSLAGTFLLSSRSDSFFDGYSSSVSNFARQSSTVSARPKSNFRSRRAPLFDDDAIFGDSVPSSSHSDFRNRLEQTSKQETNTGAVVTDAPSDCVWFILFLIFILFVIFLTTNTR